MHFLKVQNLSRGSLRCIHHGKNPANPILNVAIIVFGVFAYNIEEGWFVQLNWSVPMSK